MSRKVANPDKKLDDKQRRELAAKEHAANSSITSLKSLRLAERRAAKLERAPFDPTRDISYFEKQVVPERNYHGDLHENPNSYFDFPVPEWARLNRRDQQQQQQQLPPALASTLAQCQQRRGGIEDERHLPAPFPDLSAVLPTSTNVTPINSPPRHQQQQTLRPVPEDAPSPPGAFDSMFKEQPTTATTSITALLRLLEECEARERRCIAEHAEDLKVRLFVQMKAEGGAILHRQDEALSAKGVLSPRRKNWDRALERLVAARMDLIGAHTLEMSRAIFEPFDPENPKSFFALRDPNAATPESESDVDGDLYGASGQHKLKAREPKPAPISREAELVEAESKVAELESYVSWSKFERKRLEELVRHETADAAAARAARDAAMQQLAALEAECIPLLQGMRELFGGDSSQQKNGADGNPLHSPRHGGDHSVLGTLMASPQGEKYRTALERVAQQVDSPFLAKFASSGGDEIAAAVLQQQQQQQQEGHGGSAAAPSDAAAAAAAAATKSPSKLAEKAQLKTLDAETLASMILLERQLAQRMLIGAQSQVFAEVEHQRRFVDTSILLKKQAAHAMFLADMFQHRLPHLRRACSALGSVVHKFEACATPNVPRHRSNVVSRHNPGCSVPAKNASSASNSYTTMHSSTTNNRSGNRSQVAEQQLPSTVHNVTHSALVAYSKSLVAHVAALLRWLDTECATEQ